MGYSNIKLVTSTISQTLTSASPASLDQPIDMLKIGNILDTNLIPSGIVDQYIQFADNEIDSWLSSIYKTPICKYSDFETTLLANIDEYNNFVITSAGCPLRVGDEIILSNGVDDEVHIIATILDEINHNAFTTLEPIIVEFQAETTRVIRVLYPNPIPLMSARLAAANIYEKYFMSEASPSESKYGQWMRGLVRVDADNILDGKTILHNQHRTGRRFYNANLVDRYGLRGQPSDNKMDSFGGG